jgi:hypothetical protein
LLAAGALILCNSAWAASPYQWAAGPSSDPNKFPISVWWQWYGRSAEWSGIGLNQFVGPDAPSSGDVTTLNTYHMKTMISYDGNYRGSSVVNGWFLFDEPDNAQWNTAKQKYDPCIDPSIIIAQYNAIKAADPNRPVFLGLGQGVCWPLDHGYYGRGSGATFAQYPLYCQGGDIIAFDVYPFNYDGDPNKDLPAGKPWYVAIGVERLKAWTNNAKPIWMDIETADINGSGHPPKPYQTRGEVWMALVHGVSGIQYFAQTWHPDSSFNKEDGTFSTDPNYADPGMVPMLTVLNAQIEHYSNVLYSPVIAGQMDCNLPVNWVQKTLGNMTYVFAISMWDDPNVKRNTFHLAGLSATPDANVMDEGRKLTLTNGTFADNFSSMSVHLYEIPVAASVAQCKVASGNWTDANSWALGVPAGVLQTVVNNAGQMNIAAGAVARGTVVTLGLNPGDKGTILMTGGRLDANWLTVGQGGAGTFTQSGGTSVIHNGLALAGDAYSAGTYLLQDGNLVASRITIGAGGKLTLTGGSLRGDALDANLAPRVVSSGLIELTAGTWRIASIDCPDANVPAGTVQIDAGATLWLGEFNQASFLVSGTLILDGSLLANAAPLSSASLAMAEDSLAPEGSPLPDGSPAPEPATLVLLALGGAALLRRRRS